MATSDAPIMIDTVTLTVHDLDRVADFYARVVGLAVLARDGGSATLGADRPLLHLVADPAAPRRSPREAGLFHTAFLLPSRADLGAWLRDFAEAGGRLDGAADHGVSEALYLTDPEGNGIEIYWDKPRAAWPIEGDRIAMVNAPIDFADLAAAARGPWRGAPEGSVVGHVHLQVGDIGTAEAFWSGTMGLALTCRFPDASFFAAGGYHHHIGANVWRSRGAPPLSGPRTGLAEVALRAEPAAASAVAGRTGAADGRLADPWNVPIRVVETAPLPA